MGGLMLFGAVGIWMALSAAIGIWLGGFLSTWYWQTAARIVLVPLVFFAPVADEIIAWRQMKVLCDKVSQYEYDKKIVNGRTVRRTISVGSREEITLFPDIRIVKERFDHTDNMSGERVISWYQITTSGGKAAFPSASGTRHPWLLPEKCSVNTAPGGHMQFLQSLNITLAKSLGEQK